MVTHLNRDDLVGIQLRDGRLVTESTAKTLVLEDGSRHRLGYLRGRVGHVEGDRSLRSYVAAAILANALFWLATRKDKRSQDLGWMRGTPATQVIQAGGRQARLFIYEAGYRGTLWPRYCWPLPGLLCHAEATVEALLLETAKDGLVAERDSRAAASVGLLDARQS